MHFSRLVGCVALLAAVLLEPAVRAQEKQTILVSGTVTTADNAAAAKRSLFFVVQASDFCPSTCSCGSGKCEGGPECKSKFCYQGFMTATNNKGEFGIMLPSATYNIYGDRISTDTLLTEKLLVKGDSVKGLRFKVPSNVVVMEARHE